MLQIHAILESQMQWQKWLPVHIINLCHPSSHYFKRVSFNRWQWCVMCRKICSIKKYKNYVGHKSNAENCQICCATVLFVAFPCVAESCHGLSRLNIYSQKGMNKIFTKIVVLFSAHSLTLSIRCQRKCPNSWVEHSIKAVIKWRMRLKMTKFGSSRVVYSGATMEYTNKRNS